MSGESFPAKLNGVFKEVSLVRSEYLFRRYGIYPRTDNANLIITPYLKHLSSEFEGSIWYRTLDVDTAEANVLAGCEEVIVENDRLRGLRGVRRSMRFPTSFEAELGAISNVGCDRIGVIVPFVSTVSEAEWAICKVKEFLPNAPVGVMLEIPSLLFMINELADIGYSRIILGLNDFGSLYMGTIRKVQTPLGLPHELFKAIEYASLDAVAAGLDFVIAGYLNKSIVSSISSLDITSIAVHYSDLPECLGIPPKSLPDLPLLKEIKSKTRADIIEFNETHGVSQVIY